MVQGPDQHAGVIFVVGCIPTQSPWAFAHPRRMKTEAFIAFSRRMVILDSWRRMPSSFSMLPRLTGGRPESEDLSTVAHFLAETEQLTSDLACLLTRFAAPEIFSSSTLSSTTG
jgi:hypothetical protein